MRLRGGRSSWIEQAGTTFDLAKRVATGHGYRDMRRGEYKWLLWRLWYYREIGQILVIEERGCLHVFVGGQDDSLQKRFAGDSEELTP